MDIEDEDQKQSKSFQIGHDLSALSVGELQALIGELKSEIAQIEHTISGKKSGLEAAQSVFKT